MIRKSVSLSHTHMQSPRGHSRLWHAFLMRENTKRKMTAQESQGEHHSYMHGGSFYWSTKHADGELTAHCVKATDVRGKDIIKDILWLKRWLGCCCRCT